MGKYLILSGFLLVVMGIIWIASEQYGYKNPLDLRWEKGNTKVYFPLGTSILISLALSLIFYLFKRL
jgi:hypothetical protein